MALQKTIQYKGITIIDAYIRVRDLRVDNKSKMVRASLAAYANKDEDNMITSVGRSVTFDLTSGDMVAKAYETVKASLVEGDELYGAIDC